MRKINHTEYVEKFNNRWDGEFEVIECDLENRTALIRHKECRNTFKLWNRIYDARCNRCEHKDQFMERFQKKWNGEYEVVGEYIDAMAPIKFKHLKCGEIIEKSPSEMLRYGCQLCSVESNKIRMSSVGHHSEPQSKDVFTARLHDKYGERYSLISGYEQVAKPARFKCNECGREFNVNCSDLLSGHRECKCEFYRVRRENKALMIKEKEQTKILLQRKLQMDNQNFLEQVNEIWGDEFELLSQFKGYGEYVLVKHKGCGSTYKKLARSLIDGHGCLACSRAGRSAGVTRIEKYLDAKGIRFEREVRFKDCRRINMLSFDFVLYDKNNEIALIIEHDGEQHYRATIKFGGSDKLRLVKERDEIKNEYCKTKGIRLVRVPYCIKDIPTYLDEKMCSSF